MVHYFRAFESAALFPDGSAGCNMSLVKLLQQHETKYQTANFIMRKQKTVCLQYELYVILIRAEEKSQWCNQCLLLFVVDVNQFKQMRHHSVQL